MTRKLKCNILPLCVCVGGGGGAGGYVGVCGGGCAKVNFQVSSHIIIQMGDIFVITLFICLFELNFDIFYSNVFWNQYDFWVFSWIPFLMQ